MIISCPKKYKIPQQSTSSQENYLEHILHISNDGKVRAVDLADSVGVKLPSITKAVNKLVSQGLVQHEHYGTIELTRKGRLAARRIVKRDKSINDFLIHILKMNDEQAKVEACRLEHVLSDKVLIKLQALIDFFDKEAEVSENLHQAIEEALKKASAEGTVMVGQTKPHA